MISIKVIGLQIFPKYSIIGTACINDVYKGAYLATQKSQFFGGDTPKNGTTAEFTDFEKQVVYIGEIDPALLSRHLALLFGYAYSFTDISAIFVKDLENF